jgi:hypothetical protein
MLSRGGELEEQLHHKERLVARQGELLGAAAVDRLTSLRRTAARRTEAETLYRRAGEVLAALPAPRRTKRVAIARFVKRANAVPIIAVLVPGVQGGASAAGASASAEASVRPLLFVNKLPWREDVRKFEFASLDAKADDAPSSSQLFAAEQLIEATRLRGASAASTLEPRANLNPVLRRFYETAMERAIVPGCPVPPIDPIIAAQLEPPVAVWAVPNAKRSVDAFRAAFPLGRSVGGAKRRKRFSVDANAAPAAAPISVAAPAAAASATASASSGTAAAAATAPAATTGFAHVVPDKVGSINPVQDFERMYATMDATVQSKAMTGIETQINRCVDALSTRDGMESKIVRCLAVYRGSAGVTSSAATGVNAAVRFNIFARSCREEWIAEAAFKALWEKVREASIGLITDAEVLGSGVSAADAVAFLASAAAAVEASRVATASGQGTVGGGADDDAEDDDDYDDM